MTKGRPLTRDENAELCVGCLACDHAAHCDGLRLVNPSGAWGCQAFCCGGSSTCDVVCPWNEHFAEDLLEIRGFKHPIASGIHAEVRLRDGYLPILQHPLRERPRLRLDRVGLPLRQLLIEDQKGGFRYPDRGSLLSAFGLTDETEIVVIGADRDRTLERFWRWRKERRYAQHLRSLRVAGVTAPNYSMFLNDPVTQLQFNRKRVAIVATELAESGIRTIPTLQAVSSSDWNFWQHFLNDNPAFDWVALEFQTGNAIKANAERTLGSLEDLQQKLGRALSLVAIGGGRFRGRIAAQHQHFVIADSTPFMKASHYQEGKLIEGKIRWHRAPDSHPGDLLQANVRIQRRHLARQNDAEIKPQEPLRRGPNGATVRHAVNSSAGAA